MHQVNLVITGAAHGMGAAFARYAYDKLNNDVNADDAHNIHLLDKDRIDVSPFDREEKCKVFFYYCDVELEDSLPEILHVTHLFNNAGIQLPTESYDNVIDTNLKGLIRCTETYALNNDDIKAVLNQASVSAHSGSEFPNYVASKGGVLAYTKAIANQLAPKAICNSISFGGVTTSLNDQVMNNTDKWNRIMEVTPMKKWVTLDESSKWIWFLLFENESMTGQDVIVDNGEIINSTFVW